VQRRVSDVLDPMDVSLRNEGDIAGIELKQLMFSFRTNDPDPCSTRDAVIQLFCIRVKVRFPDCSLL
jgi:hypothetical protein